MLGCLCELQVFPQYIADAFFLLIHFGAACISECVKVHYSSDHYSTVQNIASHCACKWTNETKTTQKDLSVKLTSVQYKVWAI